MARLWRRLANRIQKLFFTLNGRRRFLALRAYILELNNCIRELNTRILELDTRVTTERHASEARQYSLRDLADSARDPGRIAVVSNLPPDTTGLASCSFYSWLGHGGPLDLFCPVSDVDWFLGNGHRLKEESHSRVRVLDVGTFLTADQINQYKAIVVTAGNSHHCVYIHDFLKKAAAFRGLERFMLHAHDPCLLNLIQCGNMLTMPELYQMLDEVYDHSLSFDKADLADVHTLSAALVRRGLVGMRFFSNLGIKHYLVNSRNALDMVRSDLNSVDVEISQVFHPVFLPMGADPALAIARRRASVETRRSLSIGTFGYPGPYKLTDRIISAAHAIQERGIEVKLIIAGFGVRAFARTTPDDLAGLSVKLLDGPTDVQLLNHMADVDVAVQLRGLDFGESSGIVAQLLALNKRVLVSDLGSFKEFGPAVWTIPVGASVTQLADTILEMSRRPVPLEDIQSYIKDRTPAHFRQAFMSAVGN